MLAQTLRKRNGPVVIFNFNATLNHLSPLRSSDASAVEHGCPHYAANYSNVLRGALFRSNAKELCKTGLHVCGKKGHRLKGLFSNTGINENHSLWSCLLCVHILFYLLKGSYLPYFLSWESSNFFVSLSNDAYIFQNVYLLPQATLDFCWSVLCCCVSVYQISLHVVILWAWLKPQGAHWCIYLEGDGGRGYLKVKVGFFFLFFLKGLLRWHCCETRLVFITAQPALALSSREANFSVPWKPGDDLRARRLDYFRQPAYHFSQTCRQKERQEGRTKA